MREGVEFHPIDRHARQKAQIWQKGQFGKSKASEKPARVARSESKEIPEEKWDQCRGTNNPRLCSVLAIDRQKSCKHLEGRRTLLRKSCTGYKPVKPVFRKGGRKIRV